MYNEQFGIKNLELKSSVRCCQSAIWKEIMTI